MRDIDLKTLRLLVAVCDHENMARAAAQEHIEPSAVSKRIAQLEQDLGTALLMRSRRGARPTPAGLAVLEHARSVLFTLERMASDAAGFSSGVKGHVRGSPRSPNRCSTTSPRSSGRSTSSRSDCRLRRRCTPRCSGRRRAAAAASPTG